MDITTRTEMLVGKDNIQRLHNATVAVFGLGGVGGYCVEALARAGVGNMIIIDNDTVNVTNINRQIYALGSTVGQLKTDVAKGRIADINSNINVDARSIFVDSSNIDTFCWQDIDYVVDAIDTVTSKLLIIQQCKQHNVPIISCMGTGNKLDATKLVVCDISQTHTCPLARVMRKELSVRGIHNVDVVYSTEKARTPLFQPDDSRRSTPSSLSTVPAVAGLLLANQVISAIIEL